MFCDKTMENHREFVVGYFSIFWSFKSKMFKSLAIFTVPQYHSLIQTSLKKFWLTSSNALKFVPTARQSMTTIYSTKTPEISVLKIMDIQLDFVKTEKKFFWSSFKVNSPIFSFICNFTNFDPFQIISRIFKKCSKTVNLVRNFHFPLVLRNICKAIASKQNVLSFVNIIRLWIYCELLTAKVNKIMLRMAN